MFFKYLYVILFFGFLINNISCDTTESITEVTEGLLTTESTYKSLRDKRIKNRKRIYEQKELTEQEIIEKEKIMSDKCVERMKKRLHRLIGKLEGAVNVTETTFPHCDYSKRTRKTYVRKPTSTRLHYTKHITQHSRRRNYRKYKKYVKTTQKPTHVTTSTPTTTSTTTDNTIINNPMTTTNILLQDLQQW